MKARTMNAGIFWRHSFVKFVFSVDFEKHCVLKNAVFDKQGSQMLTSNSRL
jgi:hypothetical protein